MNEGVTSEIGKKNVNQACLTCTCQCNPDRWSNLLIQVEAPVWALYQVSLLMSQTLHLFFLRKNLPFLCVSERKGSCCVFL